MAAPQQKKLTNFFSPVKRSLTTSVLSSGSSHTSGELPPPLKRIKVSDIDEKAHEPIEKTEQTKRDADARPSLFGLSRSTVAPTRREAKPIDESIDKTVEEPHGEENLKRPVSPPQPANYRFGSAEPPTPAISSETKRTGTLMIIEDSLSSDDIVENYDSDNSEEAKIREFMVKNTKTDYEEHQKRVASEFTKQAYEEWEAAEAQAVKTHAEADKKPLQKAPFEAGGPDRSASILKREKILTPKGHRIQVRIGDITQESVGAIVNAANSALAHGGGVAGAISRAGGMAIQRESNDWIRKFGEVPAGGVAVTGPGRLRCEKIIHAVGPVYTDGHHNEAEELYEAVIHSLLKAEAEQLTSISIPAISSGIFGFPKDECARIMFDAALNYLKSRPNTILKEIRFCNFDRPTVSIFEDEFDARFPAKPGKIKVIEEDDKEDF